MERLATKQVSDIANYLISLGCCYRCILRLIGVQSSEFESAYKDPEEFVNKLLNKWKTSEVTVPKRIKRNICIACLDCFQQVTIEKFGESFASLNINEYQYNTFFFNISFPKCLAIRAHSVYLDLKRQFPDYSFGCLYEKKTAGDELFLEQPHKIFRTVASNILAKVLDKHYHPKSNLSLLLTIGYEDDECEIANMKNIIKNKKSKKNNTEISRNNITEFLSIIEDSVFKNNFPMPPRIPDKGVFLEKVDITADPLYLGGRYFKFKRNVGQTPWIIDGVSVAEHNVQDIIFNAISNVLGCPKNRMTFTASGREDIDVRMLGTGRPFYVKIDNPKQRQVSAEQFSEIESQIIDTELAAVIKLQSIYASDLNRIKFGEEKKKKTYRALCKTTTPDIKEAISKINQHTELTISQLTVMRVLHRRTLMSREKKIYKLQAVEIPEHSDVFELEVVTQAGTYVKEFVHGDFERTQPNISSIIGYSTDLIALDCIDIDLVWPENLKEMDTDE